MFDGFDVLLVVIVGAIMLGTIRLAWEQGLDEGWRQAGAELDRRSITCDSGAEKVEAVTGKVVSTVPAPESAQPPYEAL